MALFDFRRIGPPDFAYCWPIYRDALEPLSVGLFKWDDEAQKKRVQEALDDEGASILIAEGESCGWLQCNETRFTIHLGHLYLEPAKRNKGLGSGFLRWMSERARRKEKDFTLDVMKNNPALALYERLGFKRVKASATTITMRL